MAKVLNTGKASKAPPQILSKAKKDSKSAKDEDDSKAPSTKSEPLSVRRARKKEEAEIGRKRPNYALDRAKERKLNRLAVKGVVQLFNAVQGQQKSLKRDLQTAGKSQAKREKVFKAIDKEEFMEKVEKVDLEEEEDEGPKWNILRDDYMTGAKMKDWDRDSD